MVVAYPGKNDPTKTLAPFLVFNQETREQQISKEASFVNTNFFPVKGNI